MPPYQHGFIDRISTTTNLIIMDQFISNTLDNYGEVDNIHTDFSKAFDRVDNSNLISNFAE